MSLGSAAICPVGKYSSNCDEPWRTIRKWWSEARKGADIAPCALGQNAHWGKAAAGQSVLSLLHVRCTWLWPAMRAIARYTPDPTDIPMLVFHRPSNTIAHPQQLTSLANAPDSHCHCAAQTTTSRAEVPKHPQHMAQQREPNSTADGRTWAIPNHNSDDRTAKLNRIIRATISTEMRRQGASLQSLRDAATGQSRGWQGVQRSPALQATR